MAAAGARYDLEAYDAACAEVSSDPILAEILVEDLGCDTIGPNEDEIARLAGLDPIPQGPWPSFADPRVKAIVPLGEMLAMGGTPDVSTPYDWGARPAYDYVSSQRKALVTLQYGNHFLFQAQCADASWLLELGFFFCSDPIWDIDRAHNLINHFTTAFRLATLKATPMPRRARAGRGEFPRHQVLGAGILVTEWASVG